MNALAHSWPYMVMLGMIGFLVFLHREAPRPPDLPVPLPVLTERMEVTVLAEVVRSGAFYLYGVLPDWDRCCLFATKVITNSQSSDDET